MQPIYLDYNATTPPSSKVISAAQFAMLKAWGNPSCAHLMGKEAKDIIVKSRKTLASLINASASEIIFTSGGTEANNTVLLSIVPYIAPKGHIITTQIEHPSVLNPVIRLIEMGCKATFLSVDSNGIVDPDDVFNAITPETVLVSIMLANNEVGSIQPISRIGAGLREKEILFHTDASQAIGKIVVDVDELCVDYLTIAGHKFYAPKGIGALYVRDGAPFAPLFLGGGQEGGRRPGTEPAPLIAAIGAASNEAMELLKEENKRILALRDMLFKTLKEKASVPVEANIDLSYALPNTLSIRFEGVNARALLDAAPSVIASTGAACHDSSSAISYVLSSIGLSADEAISTIRFSIGRYTVKDDIVNAASEILKAVKKLLKK